ncbi:MAG: hypothetical protein ACYC3I_11030, partial [Gemmataceae bacterium]
MRFASLLTVLAGTFLLAQSLAAAEPTPDVRTITVPEAQVWCGPSTGDGLYPTNLLRQGDRVQVERELESGWLVIRPPAGSFSWINNRFVQYISSKYANYVVTYDGHDVPVLIGSSLKSDRPNKIGVKLPRGAQVRVIGRGMTDEEGTWLPIDPPEGEVRYLRKEAVAKPMSGAQTSSSAKAAVLASDGDTLWRDAEKADRAGRLADAVHLYRLAGDANLSANPTRADEAYRRAHWIEQANSSTNAPSGAYYYPDGPTPPPAANITPFSLPVNQVGTNAIQPIGGAAPGAANGQLVSTRAVATTQQGICCEKGRLQRAFKNEVNRRYHLLDKNDHPFRSVVAARGVDL